jgi:thioredoxin reductase
MKRIYDLKIIGAGAAGITAAVLLPGVEIFKIIQAINLFLDRN